MPLMGLLASLTVWQSIRAPRTSGEWSRRIAVPSIAQHRYSSALRDDGADGSMGDTQDTRANNEPGAFTRFDDLVVFAADIRRMSCID